MHYQSDDKHCNMQMSCAHVVQQLLLHSAIILCEVPNPEIVASRCHEVRPATLFIWYEHQLGWRVGMCKSQHWIRAEGARLVINCTKGGLKVCAAHFGFCRQKLPAEPSFRFKLTSDNLDLVVELFLEASHTQPKLLLVLRWWFRWLGSFCP